MFIFLFRSCRQCVLSLLQSLDNLTSSFYPPFTNFGVSAVLINPFNTKFHGNLLTDFRVVTAVYTGGRTNYWHTFATLYCEQLTVTEVMLLNVDCEK